MTVAFSIDPQSPEITAINLARALDRLEHKILSTPPDARLLRSGYERTKTSANLEYARTLLLRLEHTSSTIKIQSRKHHAQSSLLAQRALLKRLTDRLHELEQLDSDAYSSASDGEDLLGEDEGPAITSPKKQVSFAEPAQDSSLRNRFQPPASIAPTTALLSPASATTTTTTAPTALIESEEQKQANMTTAITSMATLLKQRAQEFHAAIEVDKEVTARAGEGLDKNAQSMEAAGRKMGMLRRMSEGKGWWGRMMLYAWIGGLWIAAILLVFVGPKFRF